MVECNTAILCSCLPTIRFLIAKFLPWLEVKSMGTRYLGSGVRYVNSHLSSRGRRSRKASNGYAMQPPGGGNSKASKKGGAAVHSVPLPNKSAASGSWDSTTARPDSPTRQEAGNFTRGTNSIEELNPGWQFNFEKAGGEQYRGPQASAWANASSKSHTSDAARRSIESESERHLVRGKASEEVDFGRQILVTTTTIVGEERRAGSPAVTRHHHIPRGL